ncbi:Xanthine/uracil permease, partial [Aureobasidium melanogenum]
MTNNFKDDSPDTIGPETTPKRSFSEKGRRLVKAFTTKEGLVGDYDYGFLFKPQLPFMKKARRAGPFFGLNDRMPVFLALLLGFQHALAMLAGIITPPIILSGSANLIQADQQYLVSACLIMSGILSMIQISRFHIWKSPYYVGTGLISVVGTSFATIPVATGAFSQMYATGFCPSDANGNPLPCPDGYGALIATSCVCALLEILMSFTPPK